MITSTKDQYPYMKRFFPQTRITPDYKQAHQLKQIIYLLSIILLVGAMGCKSKYPKDIMTPEQIKPVLFDVMVATAVKQMDTSSITKLHIRDSITLEIHRVLKAHNVDDSLYFRSMAFYEAHPDDLKTLLDSTRSYGNRLEDSLQKKRFMPHDSVTKPAIRPKSLKLQVDSAKKMLKKPVNPTVKEPSAIPVEKVKKLPKKL